MGLSSAAKNQMLNNLATTAVFASLHATYPGDTGTGEISGGTPPYARQPITWNAAAGGDLDNNVNPSFNVPASTTIRFLGLWSLITAGTFLGSVPLGAAGSLPFEGDAATDTLTAAAHGLVNGQQVVVYDTDVGTLPAGLVEGTVYFVISAATNTLQLSASSGGSAIDLTAAGTGFIQNIVPETFGGQGTYAVSDVDVTLNR